MQDEMNGTFLKSQLHVENLKPDVSVAAKNVDFVTSVRFCTIVQMLV